MKTKANIDLKNFQSLKMDDLMRTEEFTPNYLKLLNISEDNLEELIEIALDKDLELTNAQEEKDRYIPCHALQTLGQLGALEPFDEILERMDFFADDDYYISAVSYYLRKVGKHRIDKLFEYFLEQNNDDGNRLSILEVLEKFMKEGSDFNQQLEALLVVYLKRDDELYDLLNASAIFDLIDLSGAKHIDLIREVFEKKPVDTFYDGDLEDIEIKLGLREKRTKPREKNFLQKMVEKYELEDKLMPLISNKEKTGRNDPCPCGSGKKYKKCCI
ncbi:MAG TPA: hypothetical protein ENK82_05435 [Campylobacterales bacterium]|nr:hypothetical protein [Campylobacterales bacterium]